MAENLENEFQGTPINLKDFGLGAFSDDEFDFLKKKPKPEEKKIPVGELAEEPLSEPPLAPPVPETTVP